LLRIVTLGDSCWTGHWKLVQYFEPDVEVVVTAGAELVPVQPFEVVCEVLV
jgi:hypothetical protein